MAQFRTTLNKFDGGRAEDAFSGFSNEFQKADHLDNITQSGRLRPYRSVEANQTGQVAVGHMTFVSHDSNLYGLGTKSGNANAKIYKKSGTITTSDWEAAATGETSGGAVKYEMFTEYKSALYFWRGLITTTGTIGKYDIDSPVGADVNGWNTVTLASTTMDVSAGLHFPNNDTLYFAYGNKLAKLDDTTFIAEEFVLPSDVQIVSLAVWDNYLAIGTKQIGTSKQSKVYFWDTIAADPEFTKIIPEGELSILRNTGDELTAITITGGNTTTIDGKFFIYTYSGGEFTERKKIITNNNINIVTIDRLADVKKGKLFFGARLGSESGIYRFGFNGRQYSFTLDRYVTNDNTETFTSAGNIEFVGDYLFAVHTANGTITRTDDQNAHAVTGIYKTLKLDGGNKHTEKRLKEVSISTVGLPSGAAVEVKFDADGSGSFTSLFTHDTDGEVKKVSRAVTAVPDYSFIEFQCEVTGFAEITELSFVYEDRPNQTTH